MSFFKSQLFIWNPCILFDIFFAVQITQTMQVPLSYAEEIIGIGGGNISFIRRTSGAVIALEESRTVPDEIVIEIKGNSTQVQTAQQLIEVIFPMLTETVFDAATFSLILNHIVDLHYHRML